MKFWKFWKSNVDFSILVFFCFDFQFDRSYSLEGADRAVWTWSEGSCFYFGLFPKILCVILVVWCFSWKQYHVHSNCRFCSDSFYTTMSLYNYLHAISPVWLDPTSMIKSWNTGIPHQIFQKKTKIETGTFTHAKTARSAPSKLWERSNWKSKPKRTKIEKSTSDFQNFQNFVQKRESCQNLNPKLLLSAEISFFKDQSTVLPIIFSQFWTWTKKVSRP